MAESNVKLEKERESLRGVRTDVAERVTRDTPGRPAQRLKAPSPLACVGRPSQPPQGSSGAPLPQTSFALREMLERSASPKSPCPLRVTGQVAALEEMLTTEHEEAAALQQLLELRRQLKGARASRREAGARLLAVSTAKDLEVGAVMLHEAALLAAPPPTAPATAHRPGHISGRCFSDADLPREERIGRSGCHPYVRALVPP